jgi:hypothetical protein
LWDGNIQDHADQGVAIDVAAEVSGSTRKTYVEEAEQAGGDDRACRLSGDCG